MMPMEDFMPQPDPPTESQGQYPQHQFTVPPLNPPPSFFHHITNADYYANLDGDHDLLNFEYPSFPMETRDEQYGHFSSQEYNPSSGTNLVTVYKKAPDAPKRFRSSYVHFFMDFLGKKKKELGPDGLPLKFCISSVSKECSRAWKALPEDQRKYWHDLSEVEKRGFNEQKAVFQGPWRIATNKVKQKKEGAPKRSPSAFFLFANARRPLIKEEHPGMSNKMVVKTCSEIWKKLPKSEKAPYLDKERRLRAQYHIDAKHWKRNVKEGQEDKGGKIETVISDGVAEQERRLTGHFCLPEPMRFVESSVAVSGRKRTRDRDPNAPKRSPPAFFLFVNHCRPPLKQEYPELRHTELVKLLGQKWSAMSEEEKRPFRNREELLRQQYHIDIQNYKKQALPVQKYYALDPMRTQHAHRPV
ncbi:hypothetical protein ACHAW5_004067 [Stephanodiscus triporus]|uniref:HMG box domain-containing protein n=1 Tax=Stephanodiscus triporus TaxID=2934178 RepID=A0ABD3MFI4_9STRA